MKHLKTQQQQQKPWNIKIQTKTKHFHLNFSYKSSSSFSSYFKLHSYHPHFTLLFTSSSSKPTIKSKFLKFFHKLNPKKSKNLPFVGPNKSAENSPISPKKSARNSPIVAKKSAGNLQIVDSKKSGVKLQSGNILSGVGVILAAMVVYLFRHNLIKITNFDFVENGVAKLVDNLLDYAVNSVNYYSQSLLQEYSLKP